MTGDARRIIVSGMVAAAPNQGGAVWAVLQYVLGLRELGHRVLFVEQIAPSALQPPGRSLAASTNAAYFHRVMQCYDLEGSAALLLAGSRETVGLSYDRILDFAAGADALLNLSGLLTDEAILAAVPVRVYVDLDPAYTQLWQAVEGIDMRLGGHTHFVTVGLAIGTPECPIPTLDVRWTSTLQPIVLSHWPRATTITRNAFTTVANWRGYGSIEYNGVHYGQKAHSLRKLIDLPTRTDVRFLLALSIHPAEVTDLDRLTANQWALVDPAAVAGTPCDYRAFVRGSMGEIGVAKSGYVLSGCGWFSDRSVCYLASGRPVVAQGTGFDRFLPTGRGLLSFETECAALDAVAAVREDYDGHAAAARALAEEYFASDRVLPNLLHSVGVQL